MIESTDDVPADLLRRTLGYAKAVEAALSEIGYGDVTLVITPQGLLATGAPQPVLGKAMTIVEGALGDGVEIHQYVELGVGTMDEAIQLARDLPPPEPS